MPYVQEQRPLINRTFPLLNVSYGGQTQFNSSVSLPIRSSSQYGWRSEGEVEAAYADLNRVLDNAKWKDTLTIVEAMDRVERSMTNPLLMDPNERPVHYRTYSNTEFTYGYHTFRQPNNPQTVTSMYRIYLDSYPPNGALSDDQIIAKGGEMMRASRPTMPHASLGQWLGELRDFGSLFKSGLSSRNPAKIAGGGYLNWQFGWKPFVSDLKKACEAVLEADEILKKFYEDSGKITRRTRRYILNQDVSTANLVLSSSSSYSNWNTTTFGSVGGTTKFAYLGVWGTTNPRGRAEVTVTRVSELRTFAKFEYFAHDPEGFAERQASYAQKARILLGLTLTPDVLWELTPWSWLADWFFDIGGFLSYQVSVQEDSLVARQSGAVFEERVVGLANCFTSLTSPYTIPDSRYSPLRTIATFDTRYQRRIPMGPYGFGPTWSLTPQQWAIVGALGLTKAPRTPRF